MSELDDFLFGGTTFTSAQIELAQSNYEARIELLGQLQRAFSDANMTKEELSAELGWDIETVDRVLAGYRDITLTDLAQLASAMDAHVSYRVAPRVSSQCKTFKDQINGNSPIWISKDWPGRPGLKPSEKVPA